MSEDDLPKNTMSLVMQLTGDGEISVLMSYNLDKEIDDGEQEYYINMIHGMHEAMPLMSDYFSEMGSKSRILEFMSDAEEGELVFEPDPELLQKISDNKVVAFKKKMH